jgi:hypothetical protein
MQADTDAIIQSFGLFGRNFVLHITTFGYEFATKVKTFCDAWLIGVI